MGREQLTTEIFIKRANKVHQGKYCYSQTNYTKAHDKVVVTCHKHGEFEVKAYAHLQGKGCPKCAIELKATKKRMNTEDFIKKSREIHGDKYDHSKTVYGKNNKESVCITCPKHGDFYVTPNNHLANKIGCPHCACKLSSAEQEIHDVIKEKFPDLNIVQKDRTILKTQEIDILIPELSIGIEYNGIRWHSENFAHKSPTYHQNKTDKSLEKGIKLIQIFENQFIENKELVYKRLFNILEPNKIQIEDYQIEEVETTDERLLDYIKNNTLKDELNLPYNCALIALNEEMVVGILCYLKVQQKAFIAHLLASNDGIKKELLKYVDKDIKELTILKDRRWFPYDEFLTSNEFELIRTTKLRKLFYNPHISQTELFKSDPNQDKTDIVRDCGFDVYRKRLR